MDVQLPADQQAVVESLVASGRFQSVDEVLSEGIRLLASTERLRHEVQAGVQQADRGELVDHDTVFARLRAMAIAAQDGDP